MSNVEMGLALLLLAGVGLGIVLFGIWFTERRRERGEAPIDDPYDPAPDVAEAAGLSEERARLVADYTSMFHNYRGYDEETLRSKLSSLSFLDDGDVDAIMECPAVAEEGNADGD